MPLIHFAATADWPDYEAHLPKALAEVGLAHAEITLAPEDPGAVDYIIYAPSCDLRDFTPYTRARAVLSLWAGVERITGNATLTQPLARMVDPGLEGGMVQWVAGHVLRHHLGLDRHIVNPGHVWHHFTPPLPQERRVTLLGLGALGLGVAKTLQSLGFDLQAWSARPKDIAGLVTHHGKDGLQAALKHGEILITLLPLTPETTDLIDAEALALMPKGSFIINPGRGPLIDDDALLAALKSGQIAHATLDVFRIEPLPEDHPYWAHPQVTVTAHTAADTRASTAARVIAENIRRGEAGEPLLHLIDRARGY